MAERTQSKNRESRDIGETYAQGKQKENERSITDRRFNESHQRHCPPVADP